MGTITFEQALANQQKFAPKTISFEEAMQNHASDMERVASTINLNDRWGTLQVLRSVPNEHRQDLVAAAQRVAAKAPPAGYVKRLGKGLATGAAGFAQGIAELAGLGGTEDEIAVIQQLEAATRQELYPKDASTLANIPVQATEMAFPAVAMAGGGALAGGAARAALGAGALGSGAAGAAATGMGAGAIETAATIGGVTAATFPGAYRQSKAEMRDAGVGGAIAKPVAAGTALVVGALEGIVPNPFKGNPVFGQGVRKAVSSYLASVLRQYPGELSEEFLQSVVSGAGETAATYMDTNAPDVPFDGKAFKQALSETVQAAGPLAILMGVPAAAQLPGVVANEMQQQAPAPVVAPPAEQAPPPVQAPPVAPEPTPPAPVVRDESVAPDVMGPPEAPPSRAMQVAQELERMPADALGTQFFAAQGAPIAARPVWYEDVKRLREADPQRSWRDIRRELVTGGRFADAESDRVAEETAKQQEVGEAFAARRFENAEAEAAQLASEGWKVLPAGTVTPPAFETFSGAFGQSYYRLRRGGTKDAGRQRVPDERKPGPTRYVGGVPGPEAETGADRPGQVGPAADDVRGVPDGGQTEGGLAAGVEPTDIMSVNPPEQVESTLPPSIRDLGDDEARMLYRTMTGEKQKRRKNKQTGLDEKYYQSDTADPGAIKRELAKIMGGLNLGTNLPKVEKKPAIERTPPAPEAAPQVAPEPESGQEAAIPTTAQEAAEAWAARERVGVDAGFDLNAIDNQKQRILQIAKGVTDEWKSLDEVTPKKIGRQAELRANVPKHLKDLRELGYAQMAWDRQGNTYHAKAGVPLPAWLTQSENDADLESLPDRKSVVEAAPIVSDGEVADTAAVPSGKTAPPANAAQAPEASPDSAVLPTGNMTRESLESMEPGEVERIWRERTPGAGKFAPRKSLMIEEILGEEPPAPAPKKLGLRPFGAESTPPDRTVKRIGKSAEPEPVVETPSRRLGEKDDSFRSRMREFYLNEIDAWRSGKKGTAGLPAAGERYPVEMRAEIQRLEKELAKYESPVEKPVAKQPEAKGAKPDIPSLGITKKDIYAAWENADALPREVIVGRDVFTGREYDWRDGKIQRLYKVKSKRGTVSTYRPATASELSEIDEAIDRGAFQVEGRAISGAIGVRDMGGGGVTRVLHQSTGRRLDGSEPKKVAQANKDSIASLLPILDKQVGNETSPRRKLQAAISVMDGEAPDVQQALAERLKEIAPDALNAATEANVPIGMRDMLKPSTPAEAVPDVVLAQKALPRDVNITDVERFLRREQEKGKPAWSVGDEFYSTSGKYTIGRDAKGNPRLSMQHELSREGLMRNFDPSEYVSYNKAAVELHDKLKAEEAEKQAAIAKKNADEDAAYRIQAAKHTAAMEIVRAGAKAMKGKKGKVKVALDGGGTREAEGTIYDKVVVIKEGKKWRLTHIPSGSKMGRVWDSAGQAKEAAWLYQQDLDLSKKSPKADVIAEVTKRAVWLRGGASGEMPEFLKKQVSAPDRAAGSYSLGDLDDASPELLKLKQRPTRKGLRKGLSKAVIAELTHGRITPDTVSGMRGWHVEVGDTYFTVLDAAPENFREVLEADIGQPMSDEEWATVNAAGAFLMELPDGTRHSGLGFILLSESALEGTLAHELLHLGKAAGLIGKQEWQSMADKYAPDEQDSLKQEEMIAAAVDMLQERDPQLYGILERVRAWVRRWLAKLGVGPMQAHDVFMMLRSAGYWAKAKTPTDMMSVKYSLRGEGKRPRLFGRPDLAKMGTSDEVRSFEDNVDEARNQAGRPAVKHRDDVDKAGDELLAADRNGILEEILAAGRSGQSLGSVEKTDAAIKLFREQATPALRSNDPEAIADLINLKDAIRETRAETARILGYAIDPLESPAERMQRAINESLIELPLKEQRRREQFLEKYREAMKKAGESGRPKDKPGDGDSEYWRREAEKWLREAQRVNLEWAKKAAELKAKLRILGVDLDNLNEAGYSRQKAADVLAVIHHIKARPSDKAYEYWRNAILSAPTTQVANALGNTLHSVWSLTAERAVEVLVNTVVRDPMGAQVGEYKYLLNGVLPGVARGARNFMATWRSESPTLEYEIGQVGQWRIEDPNTAIGDWSSDIPVLKQLAWLTSGKRIRWPQRLLGAVDDFAKSVFTEMEAGAQAYRIAKSEGKTGDALVRRTAELAADYQSQAWKLAYGTSLDLTFQQKGGKLVRSIKTHALQIRRDWPGLRYLLPFVTTPVNIFATGVKKSPLGSIDIGKKMWENWQKGEPASKGLTPQMAQQVIAWAMVLALMDWTDPDDPKITGSAGELDPASREVGFRTRPTQSIKLGDQWYSYSRLEPFATAIGMTIDWIDAFRSGDWDKMANTPLESLVGQAKNKTFLAGVADVLKALEADKPTDSAVQWASNFATSWVPNVVRSASREAADTYPQRKVWGKGGEWWSRLGRRTLQKTEVSGLTEYPIYDVWGRPANRSESPVGSDWLYRIMVPMKTQEAEMFAADRLILNYNNANEEDATFPRIPQPYYRKDGETVYMTDGQFADFVRLSGEAAVAGLSGRAVTLDAANPTDAAVRWINEVTTEARGLVRERLIEQWAGEGGELSTTEIGQEAADAALGSLAWSVASSVAFDEDAADAADVLATLNPDRAETLLALRRKMAASGKKADAIRAWTRRLLMRWNNSQKNDMESEKS